MPFKSNRQRRFMFWKHPRIAKRWAKHKKPKTRTKKRRKA